MSRKKNAPTLPESGPDWSQVADYLRKMESVHSASCTIVLSTATGGYRSFVDVDVVACLPILTGPARPLKLSLLSHFPHPKHSSLQSLLLSLLEKMEVRINSEVYRQRELPGISPGG